MQSKGRNIKLIIAYDGTDFSGWQNQNGERTVQGVIESALEKMHGAAVSITGAGRTDTGVHAMGQAANFYTNIDSIPADRFVPALNALLPQDVRILEASEEADDFHARFSAKSRSYRYNFICQSDVSIPPHESRYNLQLWRFPCLQTLNAYGRLLLGETDCSVFAASSDISKSKNRYVYNAYFYMEGNRLVFEIRANAYLRKMVRSVAGTFLHYEEKGISPQDLHKVITSCDRSQAGPTLPPQGLFLRQVEY